MFVDRTIKPFFFGFVWSDHNLVGRIAFPLIPKSFLVLMRGWTIPKNHKMGSLTFMFNFGLFAAQIETLII